MENTKCHELENINYKSMLINGENTINKKINNKLNIDELLDNECKLSKKEPWSKLDKTNKLLKIKQYVKKLNKKHNLNDNESKELEVYLKSNIDKKNLLKVKDVTYDTDKEEIKTIPGLVFNNTTRKFILKKEKHISTIKSLTPRKTKQLNIDSLPLSKLSL